MKKVLIAIVVVLAALVVVISLRPGSFHIERSVEIAAPAEVPFAIVNDLHQWSAWSPWEKLDPNMKRTFEGPEAGVGASYHWDSQSDDVGEGKMTISESTPNQKIGIKLDFLRPWEATQQVTFDFAPAGDKTRVTWGMDGDSSFMTKAMDLFVGMDSMVGPDFEK